MKGVEVEAMKEVGEEAEKGVEVEGEEEMNGIEKGAEEEAMMEVGEEVEKGVEVEEEIEEIVVNGAEKRDGTQLEKDSGLIKKEAKEKARKFLLSKEMNQLV